MARIAWLLLILSLSAFACAQSASAPPAPLVAARAALLMDRQSGLVLWAHQPDLPLPMASTTKIMTAMVILDHGSERLHEKVRVSEYAAAIGGSSQFGAGDVVTLGDLLAASLIISSNESTIAAAEFLAGDETTFVQWMNDKARELNLANTHFTNPHGFTKPERYATAHHSSARDLALMTRHALTYYPTIRKLVNTAHTTAQASPRGRVVLDTRNKILGHTVPGVPGSLVDGVKTGYIAKSGKCFVGSATVNGWQLIAVALDDPTMFQDAQTLFNYGFTHYAWKTYATETMPGATAPVPYGARREVPLGVDGLLGAPLLRLEYGGDAVQDRVVFTGEPLRAPIARGMRVGTLTLVRNGTPLLSAPAITLAAVPIAWWVRALTALVVTIIVIGIVLLTGAIYGTRTKNARRRRREFAARRRDADHGGARDD